MSRQAGYNLIAGVDEAGRGPLAGPVVASAVIMPPKIKIPSVKDSKKMTANAREKAFPIITQKAISIGIGVISPKYIDEHNILQATLEAMRQAVMNLSIQPEFILVDGINMIPNHIPQRTLVKGDQLSHSISVASVAAKVYRDRIMIAYDSLYPVYGFKANKGYGTPQHLSALRIFGESHIHRKTFKGVL